MTPKEKALELVNKYKNASFNCKGCDMPFCDIPCTSLSLYESKHCALICVDEIISYIVINTNQSGLIRDFKKEYWETVKQELEQL
jgi:hypothetical protein